jgi:hypothetical protein
VVKTYKEDVLSDNYGDSYLATNKKEVIYLFYEHFDHQDHFYCLQECTQQQHEASVAACDQAEKERLAAEQRELAKEESIYAKKFEDYTESNFQQMFYLPSGMQYPAEIKILLTQMKQNVMNTEMKITILSN